MKEIYFGDIESTDFKENLSTEFELNGNSYELEFKLGCFIQFDSIMENEVKRYHTFNQVEYAKALIKGCSRKKKRLVYFHNLKFDSKFFIDTLLENFDVVTPIETGGKMICIKCYKKRVQSNTKGYQLDCILEFRDSLAILLESLKKIGAKIGKPKLEFDFNYENEQLAIEYCYRDCEIPFYALLELYKLIIKTFPLINKRTNRLLQFDEIPYTIASFSKKIFMDIYPEVFYKVDLHMEEHLRKYYFGGRTECFDFSLLKGGIYADENSEYPFVLSNNDFSNGKSYMVHTDKINFEKNKDVLGIECKIYENLNIPLYPIRHNNEIYYTKGYKKVFMSRKEYFYLKRKGYFKRKEIRIVKVIAEFIADKITDFSKVFNVLYILRKKFPNVHFFNYVFKILMNSGYGKLAEYYIKKTYEYILDSELCTSEFLEKYEVYELGGKMVRTDDIKQDFLKINLLNAVLTTSYARFDIWKISQKCRFANVKLHYTDTDSAVIEGSDSNKLGIEFSEKFGKWKIEMNFTIFQTIDSKEYFYKNLDDNGKEVFKCKYKGVSNKYIDTLKKLGNHLKNGTYTNLIGSFKYCQIRHSASESVHIIHKNKRSFYKKRKIQSDLSTLPLLTHEVYNKDIMSQIEANNKRLILNQLKKISVI